jgi:heterodisulfide reductase subunit A
MTTAETHVPTHEERAREAARKLLRGGFPEVLGLRRRWGHVGPHVFREDAELCDLVLEPRYPMAALARRLVEARPDRRLAVVARGCDVRALKTLAKDGLFPAEAVSFVGVVCDEERAATCNCEKPLHAVTRCTGCWNCVEKCPEKAVTVASCCPILVPNEFDEGLAWRRAIYVPYPQSVPRLYLRDPDHCLRLREKLDCKGCTNICKAGAIIENDVPRVDELRVGAVVITPGFECFAADVKGDYNKRRFRDVVSSIEFERILSASGPYAGHVRRPSDGAEPRRVAFLQCVGSRDVPCRNGYCSAVCCMYAVKEAIIAKEHLRTVEPTMFFMDVRAYGKDFDKYCERAQKEYGIAFKRARVSDIDREERGGPLTVRYEDETGRVRSEPFDMVVLSVGLEPNDDLRRLAGRLGLRLNEHGFLWTDPWNPTFTSRPGLFVGGAAAGPKDIPETVTQASGAACEAAALLAPARGTLTAKKAFPPEIDVSGQEPRVGVFVCHCGINIGGVVNVPEVMEYAATLGNVAYVEQNLYTCSTDTQVKITRVIKEQGLNRVVVASCTPRTHEPLFQETVRQAGLNPQFFEMANIRDQCSWVHMQQPRRATDKAKALVRAAIAKVRMNEPLHERTMPLFHRALVVGGGVAGLTAALKLAEQGYETHLVERQRELGGNFRRVRRLPDGRDPAAWLGDLVGRVEHHPRISVYREAEAKAIDGFVGNFRTTIAHPGGETALEHGVVVVATGGQESRPAEYLHGSRPDVQTQLEFEAWLADGGELPAGATVVMIQCVGSREEAHPYCSRLCCTQALKNALAVKALRPDADVYVLYRDMRSYGYAESFYAEAREKGVVFVRYEPEGKPDVSVDGAGRLRVRVADPLLGRDLLLHPDRLVLSVRIDPRPDNEELAKKLKVPLNADKFFLEAHMKLRPVDFATDGVYLCGLAHSPKPVDESVTQAAAAAARAGTVLAKDELPLEARVSRVLHELCDGCAYCVEPCPYHAITLIEYMRHGEVKKTVEANEALCKGCGVCMATCPKQGIMVSNFRLDQIEAMVNALLEDLAPRG